MDIGSIIGIGNAMVKGYWYSKRAWNSPEAIRELQNKLLKRTVNIAYHETEFYRKKYDEHGVHPKDILTIEDIKKLPIITKQELIEHYENAIPKSLNKNRAFLMGTSGSTGQAIKIYKDYIWFSHFIGFMFRMLKVHKMGIPKFAYIADIDSTSSIESEMIGFLDILPRKALLLSVEQDMVQIMKRLEKENVNYIATYTSVMRELATLRKSGMGKNLNIIKVGLTGEILDEYTRVHIEEAFGCKCYSAYISTEGGGIGLECEHKHMHINSDSVIVEVVDQDGNTLLPGTDGNLLLTCYDAGYSTPIIRYSGCADVGQLLSEKCSCGMNTPLMSSVKGRTVDSIHLPDGRIFHAFAVTISMWAVQRNHANGRIRQYQMVQHALDKITISIVRNHANAEPGDTLEDIMSVIKKTYEDLFGPEVDLTVQEVKELPKGSNTGMPTPLVVSKINRNNRADLKEKTKAA